MYVATSGGGFSTVTDLQAVPGSWGAGWGSGGLGQLSFENAASGIALLVFGAAAWAIWKAYKRTF